MRNVCVNGYGISSALGGKRTAGGAFRAGINRFGADREFTNFVQGNEEPEPISVSCLPEIYFGFSGVGRLAILATLAFQDMHPEADWNYVLEEVDLFLIFPDPQDRSIYGDYDMEDDLEQRIQTLGERVMNQVFRNLGVTATPTRCRYYSKGQAAFGDALNDACVALEEEATTRCMIGGFDSWTDSETLEELLNNERLKCEAFPAGFIPGEAGAIIDLSRQDQPQTDISFSVQLSAQVQTDPDGFNPDAVGRHVLARCVEALNAEVSDFQIGQWYSDINGEPYRSIEWGNFQVAMNHADISDMEVDWRFPATGFGDVGCATGPLSICLALDTDRRPASSAGGSIILLSSESNGLKAALYVNAL